MSEKTLAMRVLDGKKISYQAIKYDSQMRDAEEIARVIGVDPGSVFKTLVVTRKTGKPFLVMVAADKQLDLKRMAKAVGEKKVSMASHKVAEQLTGLEVGGISALALLNRGFAICADSGINEHEVVMISAGIRGLQLEVGASDLIEITRSALISVAR